MAKLKEASRVLPQVAGNAYINKSQKTINGVFYSLLLSHLIWDTKI